MTTSNQSYPIINMAGIAYQLQRNGDDIIIVTMDRSLVDDILHSDRVLEGGYAEIEEEVRNNEPFATDEQVEELVYEIMSWCVTAKWIYTVEVSGSQHLETF